MELKSTNREESLDRLKQRSPLKKLFSQFSKTDSSRLVTSPRFFRRRHRGSRHVVSQSAPRTQDLPCTGERFYSAHIQHALDSTALWSDHLRHSGLSTALPHSHQSHEAWHYNKALVQQVEQRNNVVLNTPFLTDQPGPGGEAYTAGRQKANPAGRTDYGDLRQHHNSLRDGKGAAATEVQDAGAFGHQEGKESTAGGAQPHAHAASHEKTAARGIHQKGQKKPPPAHEPTVGGEPRRAVQQSRLQREEVDGGDERADAPEKTVTRRQTGTFEGQTKASQVKRFPSRETLTEIASRTIVTTPGPPKATRAEEAKHSPESEGIGGCSAEDNLSYACEEARKALQAPNSPTLKACKGTDVSVYTRANTLENNETTVFSDGSAAANSEYSCTFLRDVSSTRTTLPFFYATAATSSSSITQKSSQVFNAAHPPSNAAASPGCGNETTAAFKSLFTRSMSLKRNRRRTREEAEACFSAPLVGDVAEGKDSESRNGERCTAFASNVSERRVAHKIEGETERAEESNCLRRPDGTTGWCISALTRLLEPLVAEKSRPAAAGAAGRSSSSPSGVDFKPPPAASLHMTGSRSSSRSRSLCSGTARSSEARFCHTVRVQRTGAIMRYTTENNRSGKRRLSSELRPTSPLREGSVCCCCDCCSSSIIVTTASTPPTDPQQVLLYPVPPAPLTFHDNHGKCSSGNPGWYGHNYPFFRSTRIQKCGLMYWRWRRGHNQASALLLLLLQEAIKQLLLIIKRLMFVNIKTRKNSPHTTNRQAQSPTSSTTRQLHRTPDLRLQTESRMREQLLVDIGAQQEQLPHVCAAYFCKRMSHVPPRRETSQCKGSHNSRKGRHSNDAACKHCRCSPSMIEESRGAEHLHQLHRWRGRVAAGLQQRKRRREHDFAGERLRFLPDGGTAGSSRELKGIIRRERRKGQSVDQLFKLTAAAVSSPAPQDESARAAPAVVGHRREKYSCRDKDVEHRLQRNSFRSTRKRARSNRTRLKMQGGATAAADVWRAAEWLSSRHLHTLQGARHAHGKEEVKDDVQLRWDKTRQEFHGDKEGIRKPLRSFWFRLQRVTRFPILRKFVGTRLQQLLWSLRWSSTGLRQLPLRFHLPSLLGLRLLFPVRLLLQFRQRLLLQRPLWLLPEGITGLVKHQVLSGGHSLLEGLVREWQSLCGPDSEMRVRVNFVLLLLLMFPFVHGIYIPCLVLIWLFRRAHDACWWVCATRCCRYCSSKQQLSRWQRQIQKQRTSQQRAPQQETLQQQQPRQRHEKRNLRHHGGADVFHEKRQQQGLLQRRQENKSPRRPQRKQKAQKKKRRPQQSDVGQYEWQGTSGQQGHQHNEAPSDREQQQAQQMPKEKAKERKSAEQRIQQQATQWHHIFSQLHWLYLLCLEFVRRGITGAKCLLTWEEPRHRDQFRAAKNATDHPHFTLYRDTHLLQAAYRCWIFPVWYLSRAFVLTLSALLLNFVSTEPAQNRSLEGYAAAFQEVRCVPVVRRVIAVSTMKFVRLFGRETYTSKCTAVSALAGERGRGVLAARNRKDYYSVRSLTSDACTGEECTGRLLGMVSWNFFLTKAWSTVRCVFTSLRAASAEFSVRGGLPRLTLGKRWREQTGKLLECCFSLANGDRENKWGRRRKRDTEILSTLNGQELVLFSQPHLVVCGVGYTEKLTRDELLQVVRKKLLGQREETGMCEQLGQGDDAGKAQRRNSERAAHQRKKGKEMEQKGTGGEEKKEGEVGRAKEKEGEAEGRIDEEEEKKAKEAKWQDQTARGEQEDQCCHPEDKVADNSSEEQEVPLLCFKHPRLRTAVRKVLRRYCWVRDENFSAARHVVSLNRQQVLALLALHQGQRAPSDFHKFKENLSRRQANFPQDCPACGPQHRGDQGKRPREEKETKKTTCPCTSEREGRAELEQRGENQKGKEETEGEKEDAGETEGSKGCGETDVGSRRRLRSTAGRRGQASRRRQQGDGINEEEHTTPSGSRRFNCEHFKSRCSRATAASSYNCNRQEEVEEGSAVRCAPLRGRPVRRGSSAQRDTGSKSRGDVPVYKSSNSGAKEEGKDTRSSARRRTTCISREDGTRTSDVATSCCCNGSRKKAGAGDSRSSSFESRSSSNTAGETEEEGEERGYPRRPRLSVCSSIGRDHREDGVCSDRLFFSSAVPCRNHAEEERNCSKRKTCDCGVVRMEEAQALVTLLASQSLPPGLPLWQFVLLESVELPGQERPASEELGVVSAERRTITSTKRDGPEIRSPGRTLVAGAAAGAERPCGCSHRRGSPEKEKPRASCEVDAAPSTPWHDIIGAAVQSRRTTVATETTWKRGSSCKGRRRVDGRTTPRTSSTLTDAPRTRVGLKDVKTPDKDNIPYNSQSPFHTKKESRTGEGRDATGGRPDTAAVHPTVGYETSSPWEVTAVAEEDSCDVSEPPVGESKKRETNVGGYVSTQGPAGHSTKRSLRESANDSQRGTAEGGVNRSSRNASKPCVGSLIVFRIHHAVADGIALTNMFLSDVFTASQPMQQSRRVVEQQDLFPALSPVTKLGGTAADSNTLDAAIPGQEAAVQQEQHPEVKEGGKGIARFEGTEVDGEEKQSEAGCKVGGQRCEEPTGIRSQTMQQDTPICTPSTTAASSPASSGRYFDGESSHRYFSRSTAKHLQEQPEALSSAAPVLPASACAGASSAEAAAAAESNSVAGASSYAAAFVPAVASTSGGSWPAVADVIPAAAAALAERLPASARPAASYEVARRLPRAAPSSVPVSSTAADTLRPVACNPLLPVPGDTQVLPTDKNSVLPGYSSQDELPFCTGNWDLRRRVTLHSNCRTEATCSALTAAAPYSSPGRCRGVAAAPTANVSFDSTTETKAALSGRSIKPLVPPFIQPPLLPRMLLHIVAYLQIPWHVCSLLVMRRDRSWDRLAQLRCQRSGWAHDIRWIRFDLQRLRRLRRSLAAATASAGVSEQTSTHGVPGALLTRPTFRFLYQHTAQVLQRSLSVLTSLLMKRFTQRGCDTNSFSMCGRSTRSSSPGPADPGVVSASALLKAPVVAAEFAGKCDAASPDACAATAVDDDEAVKAAAAPRRLSVAVLRRAAETIREFAWLCVKRSSCGKGSASDAPSHARLATAPLPSRAAAAMTAASASPSGAATKSFTINELLTSCVVGGICRYVRAKAAVKPSQLALAVAPKTFQPSGLDCSSSPDAFALASLPRQASRGGPPIIRRCPRPRQNSLVAVRRITTASSRKGRKAKRTPATGCCVSRVREASADREALCSATRANTDADSSSNQDGTSKRLFSEESNSLYRKMRRTTESRDKDKFALVPARRCGACCSACKTWSSSFEVSQRDSSSASEMKPRTKERGSYAHATPWAGEQKKSEKKWSARQGCAPAAACSATTLHRREGLDVVDKACEHVSCYRKGKETAHNAAEKRICDAGYRGPARADVPEGRSVAQTAARNAEAAAAAEVVAAGTAVSRRLPLTAEANARLTEVTVGEPFLQWERETGQSVKAKPPNFSWKAAKKKQHRDSQAATDVEEIVATPFPPPGAAAAADAVGRGEVTEAPTTTLLGARLPLQSESQVPLQERGRSAAISTETWAGKRVEGLVRPAQPADDDGKHVCSGLWAAASAAGTPHICRSAAKTDTRTAHEDQQVPKNSSRIPEGLQQMQQLLLHLNLVVPVNLRTTEEESFQLRNNFTSAVVQLDPADLFSAVSAYERLVKVRARLRKSVRSVGACVFGLMERICFATTPDFTWFLHMWLTNKLSMLLSNVPGPSELPHIHGRQVYTMHFVGCLVGKVGINASAFSYADNLDLVLHIDRAVLDSPDLLRQCILDEYQELEQLCIFTGSPREHTFDNRVSQPHCLARADKQISTT